MEFASGAVGQITTSFDVWGAELPRIEVYGTEGSLSVPDPNGFGGRSNTSGDVMSGKRCLSRMAMSRTREVGVADMANALRTGRSHRAEESSPTTC